MNINNGRSYQLTFDNEVGVGSNRFHHPTPTSGVTIGAGYDFKHKTKEEVLRDFYAISNMSDFVLDDTKEYILTKAIGLSGDEADDFVEKYSHVINLTNKQQSDLFQISISKYIAKCKEDYEEMFKDYQKPPFLELPKEVRALMIDFTYNLGTLKTFPKFFTALLTGDRKGAMSNYMRYTGGKPLGRRNKDTKKVLDSMLFKSLIKKV